VKPLSRRAESLPRSGIREIMERASGLSDVIHLEVGEPSFGTPSHIIEAAYAAAQRGFTRYTSNYGIPELRQVIAERYTAAWGIPVKPEQTLVTAGGVNAVAVTTFAIIEDGDEVLVPDPGWPNYMSIIGLAAGKPVRYPLRPENGYLPDIDEIRSLITPRTKILILNNPSNPTGVVFPPQAVAALVEMAAQHDLYMIADEIYEELVFDGAHTPAAVHDPDSRVITVSGFSKTYAMTGWRLGYAIGREELVTLAGKLVEPLVSCPTSISQHAGVAALTGPQDAVDQMRAAYVRRRDLVRQALEPEGLLPTVPSGAFYALVDLRGCGKTSRDLAFGLLEDARVAVAPGDTFGSVAEGMVRISLASSDEDVAEGCRRIIDYSRSQSIARVA
jgi:aspartate/methionine/tyrosine aminotransferase